VFGLGDSIFTADKLEHYGAANCMKAGLVYADEITTVSPSYAEEIQTAYYGERLDGLLRAKRAHLSGVLNGIDVDDYAPEKDPQIYAQFDPYHLGGKEYCTFTPRGQYIGHEPFNKWTKVSCVLMGEDNYSDASGFPYAYRSLGLGKLIGAPVPGTMTAVWWETQVNALLVFGIPQVGNWGTKDQRYIENFQIEPDIPVYNTPEATLSGRDLQLEAAVAEMLKEIGQK
jgi:hypothetical protein